MHDHKCIGNFNYRDLTSTNKAVQNADLTLKQKQYTLLINNASISSCKFYYLPVIIHMYMYMLNWSNYICACVYLGSTSIMHLYMYMHVYSLVSRPPLAAFFVAVEKRAGM